MTIRENVLKFLRWSEKYTKTDMVYLAKGGFWLSTANFVVSFILFLKLIVFGRYLPQEAYGTYNYVISTMSLFAMFSLPGIHTSLFRSIAQKKEGTFILAIKTRIKWGLIGSLLSLLLSSWYFINKNNFLGILFLLSALFLPFINSFNLFIPYLQAKKKFKKYAICEMTVALIVAFSVIPFIIITDNIFFILFFLFLSQFLSYGIITKNIIKNLENKEEDKTAISFGKDLTLMGVVSNIAEQIDKVIIWKFLGPAQVAIYSFAQTPVYKIMSLIPIHSLALPKLGERNIKEIKKEILNKFGKLFFLSIPFAIFIILISPIFYKIALPQYIDSIPYFQGFAIIIAFFPFSLIGSALIVEIKKKDLYILSILSPSLKIILFFVLVPFFGIWGIISAILISHTIGSLLSLYFFMKI